jgi:hypothetical protein
MLDTPRRLKSPVVNIFGGGGGPALLLYSSPVQNWFAKNLAGANRAGSQESPVFNYSEV